MKVRSRWWEPAPTYMCVPSGRAYQSNLIPLSIILREWNWTACNNKVLYWKGLLHSLNTNHNIDSLNKVESHEVRTLTRSFRALASSDQDADFMSVPPGSPCKCLSDDDWLGFHTFPPTLRKRQYSVVVYDNVSVMIDLMVNCSVGVVQGCCQTVCGV